MELLLYVGAGIAAGFLGGLLGIGGGLVIVPVLAAVFASQHVDSAVLMPLTMGTSMATIIFTSISSVRAHHGRGAVDWTLVRRMAPGLACGAICGALLSSRVSGAALQAGFVMYAALSATQMLLGSQVAASRARPGSATLVTAGGALGAVSGLLGVGSATLAVPFMTWRSVPLRTAIGSASALGLPIALAGTTGYIATGMSAAGLPAFTLGYVHLPALASVVAASVICAPIGAAVSHRLPVSTLKKLFAGVLYVVAGKMLLAAV